MERREGVECNRTERERGEKQTQVVVMFVLGALIFGNSEYVLIAPPEEICKHDYNRCARSPFGERGQFKQAIYSEINERREFGVVCAPLNGWQINCSF